MAVVKSLTNDVEFLVNKEDWDRLPWSGWKVNKNGYVCNCGLQLHRLIAYLNGMLEDDPNWVIDHKNRNRLDNRLSNLRTCTAIQNGWNNERKHGHKLKNGKWKFTFRKSFPTYQDAEEEIRTGRFDHMSENRTCFNECVFDTYQEGYDWWKFQAGIHYGEFSPFANPYQSVEEIIKEQKSN